MSDAADCMLRAVISLEFEPNLDHIRIRDVFTYSLRNVILLKDNMNTHNSYNILLVIS